MKGAPSCRVYLVRHGETANAGEVCFNGHFDVKLSPSGEEQIQKVSDALKNVPLKAIYSSDLIRTKKSAEIVCMHHDFSAISYAEFRELSFGEWEGLSVREVNERFPNTLEKRLNDIETFQVKGGENFQQLKERVIPKFEKIIARHQEGGCIAVLSHGGVNRIILSHILGMPIKNIFRVNQEYSAVNIIQYYGDSPVVELIGGSQQHIHPPTWLERKISIQ